MQNNYSLGFALINKTKTFVLMNVSNNRQRGLLFGGVNEGFKHLAQELNTSIQTPSSESGTQRQKQTLNDYYASQHNKLLPEGRRVLAYWRRRNGFPVNFPVKPKEIQPPSPSYRSRAPVSPIFRVPLTSVNGGWQTRITDSCSHEHTIVRRPGPALNEPDIDGGEGVLTSEPPHQKRASWRRMNSRLPSQAWQACDNNRPEWDTPLDQTDQAYRRSLRTRQYFFMPNN